MNEITEDSNGVHIGKTAQSQIGFYGVKPHERPASDDQAAIGDPTYADPDAVPAHSSEETAPTTAEFNAALDAISSLRTQVIALAADVAAGATLNNELRGALVRLGLIKGEA